MKKVLIISQHGWPPKSNAQILRLVGLTKHLSEYGWEPIVVARETKRYDVNDSALAEKVIGIKCYFYRGFLPYRSRIQQILKWLFIPDVFLSDLVWNAKRIEKIIKKEKPDVILVSTPPSGFIFGYLLSKKFNVPLVLDYADSWTSAETYRPPTRLHKKLDQTVEKRVISASAAIVGVSPTQIAEIRSKFKSSKNFFWIPNGFEETVFEKAAVKKENQKIFLYGGTIYREFDLSFLEIFMDVFTNSPEVKNKFKVRFVGRIAPSRREYIESIGNGFVEILGKVSQKDFCSNLLTADILIFSRNRKIDKDAISSRIPEYIRSKKPIMAFIDKNTLISEIVRKAGTGFVFDESEKEKAKEFITKVIEEKIEVKPNMKYIMRFEWENITRKLAEVLGGAVDE